MKRSKRIYLLLGILVVACIATIIVRRVEEHKEKIKNSDEIILKIPSESVKTLSWEYESNTLSFHKDEKWIYDEDEDFPVDEEKINELLAQFKEFGVSFIIEDVEDYGQYGLADPTCTIKFSTDEKTYEVKLGDFSTMDSQRYVSIGDGNVYLVKNDPLDHFDATLSDVIHHDETLQFDKVTEIKFTGTENYNVVYEEGSTNTYNDDDVYFAQQDGKKLPLDTTKVKSYLYNISSLSLLNYTTYNVSDEELKKYGLDAPELTVTVNYTKKNDDGEEISDTYVLNVSRDPEEKKAAEASEKEDSNSSEEKEITAYARVGESKIVYKITSAEYKNLMAASYNSLRHKEVFAGDFADINKIDISLEGTDYTITTEKKDDKRTYYYKEEELTITNLKSALQALEAESFTDEQPKQKKEISLTLYLDNENFSKIQIDLYRYDGTNCLAVVDGKPVSLIKRSNVVDLIEAVHAIVLD
ncbi:DUF4340 domain-containing protein [Clostridium thermarum]|uniref:DUF4340 domain-containing protein n=1 Tax=Clostridium thermarum TaxID=1716543 RepID=UPI00111CDC34|nr:DUF4340 domain-containing protein [Clostridium thermarum]